MGTVTSEQLQLGVILESMSLVEAYQRKGESKLLSESSRCQKKNGSGTTASWREKPARFGRG